jgi:hypothetical protein
MLLRHHEQEGTAWVEGYGLNFAGRFGEGHLGLGLRNLEQQGTIVE